MKEEAKRPFSSFITQSIGNLCVRGNNSKQYTINILDSAV